MDQAYHHQMMTAMRAMARALLLVGANAGISTVVLQAANAMDAMDAMMADQPEETADPPASILVPKKGKVR